MAGFLQSASFVELVVACYAAMIGLTLASIGAGLLFERVAWKRGRKVFAVPLRRGQYRTEAIGTALFVLLFAPALAAALASGSLRFTEGWLAQTLSFFAPLFAFQFFYYWLHRAMHTKALFWMHAWHHESHVTTPVTGFSMHPVETLFWILGLIGPALVLARVDLLALEGYTWFLGFLIFGNIVGHSNAELMPTATTWHSSLATNAYVYHALHHARYTGHYGFLTSTLDRIFGTEWPDWLPLHRKIMRGEPLERLQQRGA